MSTGVSQVLIEGVPRRFFGDFLIAQKVTSARPGGQRLPLSKNKDVLGKAEAKRSFAESSFAYFSFKKSRGAEFLTKTALLFPSPVKFDTKM